MDEDDEAAPALRLGARPHLSHTTTTTTTTNSTAAGRAMDSSGASWPAAALRRRPRQLPDDQVLRAPLFDEPAGPQPPSTWSLLLETLFYSGASGGAPHAASPLLELYAGATNSTAVAAAPAPSRPDEFQVQWANLLLALVLIALMLTTAVGNLFVIVAILIERNLHTVGNYLVLSLAIADLLVALLVMPLAGIYQILEQWTLGILLCDIWTSADVFCCTASILHLLAIALDRYWAVTRVDYIRCQRNERRILCMILLVWVTAAVISLAPIFGWKDEQFEWRITQEKECLISQDIGYQIFATCTTFYLPLILTLIFYWKIYQVARKRIRRKLDNRAKVVAAQHPSSSSSAISSPSSKKLLNQPTARRRPARGPANARQSKADQPASAGAQRCACLCHAPAEPQPQPPPLARHKTLDDNQSYALLRRNLDSARAGATGPRAPLEAGRANSAANKQQQRRQKDNNSSQVENVQNRLISLPTSRTDVQIKQDNREQFLGDENSSSSGSSASCRSAAALGARETNDSDTLGLQQNGFIGRAVAPPAAAAALAAEQQQSEDDSTSQHQQQQRRRPAAADGGATITPTSDTRTTCRHSAEEEQKSANQTNGGPNMTADSSLLQLADDDDLARETNVDASRPQRASLIRASPGMSSIAGRQHEPSAPAIDEHRSRKIRKLSQQTINSSENRTCLETNEQRRPRRKSSVGQQRQMFYSSHRPLFSARKRHSAATSHDDSDETTNNQLQCSQHNLVNDSSGSQFSLSVVHCEHGHELQHRPAPGDTSSSLVMIAHRQRSSLCDDIDCCACECNCDAATTSAHDELAPKTSHSLEESRLGARNQSAPNVSNEHEQRAEFGARAGDEATTPTGKSLVVVELAANNEQPRCRTAAPQEDLESKQRAAGEKEHLGAWPRVVARLLSSASRLVAICWRQLRTSALPGDDGAGLATAHPRQQGDKCSFLVDKFGKSSLLANGVFQSRAADRETGNKCTRCPCSTQLNNDNQLAGGEREDPAGEPAKGGWPGKQNVTHLSLDENDLSGANSLRVEQPSTLIVAASTANIAAVTTTVRANNINSAKAAPAAAAKTTVGQQQHNQSMSIEGVESKRERKAAKTLSIITGVFVMCWLPFFIMAITMPLLQLRPHKYVFAVLLWLGYVNSMLNPIIYTIFSPDFRKAFKHLLCGMQMDAGGGGAGSAADNSKSGRASRLRPGPSGVGHSLENGTSAGEWRELGGGAEPGGCLAGFRRRLAQIHPALAALCCCCCCCCLPRGPNVNSAQAANQRHRLNKTTALEPPSVSCCDNSNMGNTTNNTSYSPGTNANWLAVAGANRLGDNVSFDDSHCTTDTMASASLGAQLTPMQSPARPATAAQVRRITNNF